MSSIFFIPEIILDNIDPNKIPQRPEKPLSDYDDSDLEDDCPIGGEQVGVHTTSDICNCMSKGEKQ